MNPNPTIDNDLQKAIDDITNNTNSDPVFGDSIATPEPISAPTPEPVTPPAPKPVASFPETGMPPAPKPVMDFKPSSAPAPMPPVPTPAPVPPMPAPEPVKEPEPEPEVAETTELKDVKEAVLRDLAPMVNKIDMDPSKKFNLYKEIREDLHDDSVIASAYEVSKEITDDKERADALLYLYDSLK